MMTRTKLTVAYLGGGFSGWQRQTRTRTVQGELERALKKLTGGRDIAVVGAGRTDAGVHAAAQTAHVDLPDGIPTEVLPKLINTGLDSDLRVRSARSTADTFHARMSALGKHYAYRVRWTEPELPWQGLRSAVLPRMSEVDAMTEACRRLPGRRDWSSFTVPEVAKRGAVRTVHRIELTRHRAGFRLDVFGEGFLRYQVRRMAGALMEVGRGRMTTGELLDLLESPSPGAPIPTAPARGLSLERVYYKPSRRLSSPAGREASLW